MTKATDVKITGCEMYLLPATMRVPIKFGKETVDSVICSRICVEVEKADGTKAKGWGETPLSVTWVWPAAMTYDDRFEAIKAFSVILTEEWSKVETSGHPMEISHAFQHKELKGLLDKFNADRAEDQKMPWLAALVCLSPFDIALHDAYGIVNEVPVYSTYNSEYMNQDLSAYVSPAEGAAVDFAGKYPCDFFAKDVPEKLPVWHLVGGVDPLDKGELKGTEPDDGYPVTLDEWIKRDGLDCLKIKLCGTDSEWDYNRLVKIGQLAIEQGTNWLTTDFNCTVMDPQYVNDILDKLVLEYPRIYGMILYVEQPFPYHLEENQIDVHSVSARKPLFMDESAHDWELVRLGRTLGWTGVALKTCKTQTGALLTMCWAKAHGMTLMVQDLTNPMIAMIPHLLLAAHSETIMGVECNGMQFYPAASELDEKVHPGLYTRREGILDLSSIKGNGFGYRIDEVGRELPEATSSFGI
ncbi:MAG: enolase C-terminal domain-like protein [Planctomycetota bacterium]|jgi:L-alanine-DL-glutamate epimerase-like enolase superfamily enzyme